MFKRLRVKNEPPKIGPGLGEISISQLIGDASLPVTIRALNSLPENPKMRLYRTLIPIQVLAEFDINPRTWKNPDKLQQVKQVRGVHVLAVTLGEADAETLRQMVDRFRQQFPTNGVVVLASVRNGNPTIVAGITPDLTARNLNAVELIKFVAAPLGGGGGGKSTLAQAGGRDASKLTKALDSVEGWVAQHLKD